MSNLPIEFEDKENSPELLAFLEQYGPTKYLSAEEINKIRDCINELADRNPSRGYWNAATNTPELENGIGRPGDYFEVSVPGENFSYTFAAGDRIEYTVVGIWVKTVDNNQTPDLTDYYNKSEVEALVVGLWDDRGAYTVNASGNINYPSSGGSGASGALLKGDIFTVAGAVVGVSTVNSIAVNNGDTIRALVDSPSATNDAHWTIAENNIGYVPENSVNKENTTLDTSTTKYPTNRLVKEYVDAKVPFNIIKDYPNQIVISATGNSFTNIGTYAHIVTGTQSDLLIGGSGISYRKILSNTTAGSNANFYDASIYKITGTKGFYYRARIKNDDPTNIPTARFSYGLSGTAIMVNINPSTYTLPLLSFGADNSDSNCQIMYKNSVGTATKIDLGSTMPKSSTDEYVIEFWRLDGTTTINYKITNLTTSAIITGSFVFAFNALALGCFRNNDIATTAVSFAIRRIELYIND